ncbi:MAG TPA: DEAD/DEAH box helicase family protein [Bacillota bacterium]|nr:DEAD/DEAH box helicase family protein [Bacillota bacterium]
MVKKPITCIDDDDLALYSKMFTGKLLLRQEIDIPYEIFDELLHLKFFKQRPSIRHSTLQQSCVRCGNSEAHLFGHYPCIQCQKEHIYCRKCIVMGRISACEPLYEWIGPTYTFPSHDQPCSWKGTLTHYQERAAEKLVSAIEHGQREFLIWAVCGSGKTEMLFPGLTRALQLGMRICIATPRADVVRELLPRLQEAFRDVHIQGLYSGSPDKEGTAQLIISTTHQLLRFQEAFDVVIIDEVDAFPYHADASLPFATERAKKKRGTMIYLTATPRQKERRRLMFKRLPYIFVPVRYHNHPLPVPQLQLQMNLQKQLHSSQGPDFFFSWLERRENKKRQILIFASTIQLAEKLAKTLTKPLLENQTIRNEHELTSVHSEDPDRMEKISRYRKKEIFVLITTTILERGVTFPSVDVLVFDAGHEVFDEAALVQIAGRAGRSANDPTGDVIFFHDGKTKAMVRARKSIEKMNRRANFK